MVLPEPSRAMAYKPRKTVYRLAREQLHLNKAKLSRSKFPYVDQYKSRVWRVNHLFNLGAFNNHLGVSSILKLDLNASISIQSQYKNLSSFFRN